MARAIILPVAMGISKPVDPNCMSDRRKTGEDIFRLPPASLLRVPTCEDDPVEGGGVDNDAESEMGDGEEEMTGIGVPTHDASSTATTGSNLLYLSDQVCYMYMYMHVIDRTCKNSSNTCTLYIHDIILCTLGDCVYYIVVPISGRLLYSVGANICVVAYENI